MSNWLNNRYFWRTAANYLTLGCFLVVFFAICAAGFNTLTRVPADVQAYTFAVVPFLAVMVFVYFDHWYRRPESGRHLYNLWTFLIGVCGPVFLTWSRHLWPLGFRYRWVPLVISLAALAVELFSYLRVWSGDQSIRRMRDEHI